MSKRVARWLYFRDGGSKLAHFTPEEWGEAMQDPDIADTPAAFEPGGSKAVADPPSDLDASGQPKLLADVLLELDPEEDEHWTQAGLPAMDAVEARLGQNCTRADVSAAIPGFDRDKALAEAVRRRTAS